MREGDPLYSQVHEGDGPPLLLVHGMLASRAQWSLNLEALRRVATPVAVELLGHARSSAPEAPEDYHPDRYVERFERLREQLGVERWSICGQSLGAALTLRYALDHPERVTAQIFTNSNSALADADWRRGVALGMRALATRLSSEGATALEALPIHPRRSRRIPAEARAALVADCATHDPRGIALSFLHTVPDSSVRERIAGNRVPTLLVVGEREERFSPQRCFAEAHMPHLEVVATPAGHAVNLESADLFNASVAAFLGRAD